MVKIKVRDKQKDDGYILFKDMQPYDIGIIHPDESNYGNEVIICFGDRYKRYAVSLSKSNLTGSFWSDIETNHISIKLLPKGTIIELEVQ